MQVLTVLMAWSLAFANNASLQADVDLRSARISMTREGSALFALSDRRDVRQDPWYSVTIAGDGTVTYVGQVGVRTLGRRTHKVEVETVRALLEEFEQAGFWSLLDRYESVRVGNGIARTVSDLSRTTVVLSAKGRTKSVYDYYGTSAIVRHLEDRIDEVAETRRYTGRPPNRRLSRGR